MGESKQYSRRQIEEAIGYWTSQLHLMSEARNALIDRLEQAFGHDVVFSWAQDYSLSQEDCQKMFNIINTHLFNNQLKPIPIFWWPESKVVEQLNQNAVKSNSKASSVTKAKCYGVYSGVCNEINDSNGDIVDFTISDEAILMNKSRLHRCTFIFAVACVCHEMIHYYDRFTKEFHDKHLQFCQTDEDFDSHKDEAFQQKMAEANSYGIDVVEDFGKVNTFTNVNSKARYKLFTVVGEKDNGNKEDIVTRFDGHTLVMRNKKTGTGFFAMFD